ncbi:MAG: TlpA disulfide reductase family protein [bacterium]
MKNTATAAVILAVLITALLAPHGCAKIRGMIQRERKDVRRDARVGHPAPLFTLRDLEGGEVALRDFRGKKFVFLSFWATWCASCREEMPVLDRIHEKFGRKGLVVLGVNVQESEKKVKSFIKKLGVKYPILLDGDGKVANLSYHLYGIPANFIINREGVIIYEGASIPENHERYFERLLEEE